MPTTKTPVKPPTSKPAKGKPVIKPPAKKAEESESKEPKHAKAVLAQLKKRPKSGQTINQISDATGAANGPVNVALRYLIDQEKAERRQATRKEHGTMTGKLPHIYFPK